MERIIEAIPGHEKEVLGIGIESVIAACISLIVILIIREIVG